MSYTKTPISGKYADMLDTAFGVTNSFYEFNPGKLLMPPVFDEICQSILDAKVKEDDVWLVSYPRTGSTWTQEIIWLIGNDLDFENAKKTIQQLRAPMIELSTYFAEYKNFISDYGNSVELCNNWPSPRFIKTHLPVELLPVEMDKVKPKIIYVARHPKDLCVSLFHHFTLLHHMKITFDEFAEMFLNEMTPMGPVFKHYLGFWAKRNDPNVLFLKYEDLKRDTKAGIRQIAEFMGKTLTDAQVNELCEFLSVDNMRKNPGCNLSKIVNKEMGDEHYFENSGKSFIRKGQVGDYKNHMSEELDKQFDEYIAKNIKGTGLSFDSS